MKMSGLVPRNEFDGILLLVEVVELFGGISVGIEVGSKAPVILFVCIVDEGISVRRLGMEEFNKPWGKGR